MPKVASLGIGKSTLRGLRKCPKCGIRNGSRIAVCKNKACNATLKEYSGKKKCWSDACRLDTGSTTKIFSVRVSPKDADCRGFVQLPAINLISEANSGLCFVEHCAGSFNRKVLQCHESKSDERPSPCQHITSAMNCNSNAQPLPLNVAVLDALSLEPTIKEEVWRSLSESVGPTVQRVSRSIMAVKCRATPKTPLGYLHVTFTFGNSDEDNQFSCPCLIAKDDSHTGIIDALCVHFYACICALVCQDALRDEFCSFIRPLIANELSAGVPPENRELISPTPPAVNEADSELCNLLEGHVEVLEDDVCTIFSQTISEDVSSILAEDAVVFSTVADLGDDELECQENLEVDQSLSFPLEEDEVNESQLITMNTLDLIPSTSSSSADLLTLDIPAVSDLQEKVQTSSSPHNLEIPIVPYFLETVVQAKPASSTTKRRRPRIGSSKSQVNFLEWLGSVTETINQHMHYQFPGRNVSVVFQSPAKFFERLKERMYKACRRKVHCMVSTFSRKDKIPIGTFSKFCWTLISRMQVKAIFDTPNVPLNLVKSFVRNSDGSYDPADQVLNNFQVNGRVPLYKTYLRIGLHSGETEPALFKIQWVPNVLPRCHVGELIIDFEYGHEPSQSVNL